MDDIERSSASERVSVQIIIHMQIRSFLVFLEFKRINLDFVALEVHLAAVDSRSSSPSCLDVILVPVFGFSRQHEAGRVSIETKRIKNHAPPRYQRFYLRRQLTQNALGSHVRSALRTGLANVLLKTFIVRRGIGPDVSLHHGDPSNSGVADGVFLPEGSRRHGAVREGRLERVQEVDHDVDELTKRQTTVEDSLKTPSEADPC
jgi:hypothetical protein